MAATVIINRTTGAGPTKTDITSANTRASASDSPSPGASDPITVPVAGTNYSYWVSTRLEVTVTPGGTVDNIRWHTVGGGGSYAATIDIVVQTATAYTQATGTVGTSGDVLNTTNYPSLAAAPVNIDTLSEGSPLSVSGSITNPSIGDFGDFVVWQVVVASGAPGGTQSQETARFRYDET